MTNSILPKLAKKQIQKRDATLAISAALVQVVRGLKRGRVTRTHQVELPFVVATRAKTGLT